MFIKNFIKNIFRKKNKIEAEEGSMYECVNNSNSERTLTIGNTYYGFKHSNSEEMIDIIDDTQGVNTYSIYRFKQI